MTSITIQIFFFFTLLASNPGPGPHAEPAPAKEWVPAEVYAPASNLVPVNWIADYDYVSDLNRYLKARSDAAREEGKVAYAYFFTDEYKHCRDVRRLMNKQRFQETQTNVVMIMLNYDYFRRSFLEFPKEQFSFGFRHPLVLRVTPDGHLSPPILLPADYIFHPRYVRDRHVSRLLRKNLQNPLYRERMLEKRMRDYFGS